MAIAVDLIIKIAKRYIEDFDNRGILAEEKRKTDKYFRLC